MLARGTFACLLAATVFFSGCSTTIIDEYRENPSTGMVSGESIVVLGRRNSASYETEFDFINCVGRSLQSRLRDINVIPEKSFIDSMYPHFETSTAPMDVQKLEQLMQMPEVAGKLDEFQIRYFVWIDGFTETTNQRGALSCTVGPGGGRLFRVCHLG